MLSVQNPHLFKRLEDCARTGQLRFNVVIHDVLGSKPELHAMAVTPAGEAAVGGALLNPPVAIVA